jgi:hypothetical protein
MLEYGKRRMSSERTTGTRRMEWIKRVKYPQWVGHIVRMDDSPKTIKIGCF